MTSLTIGIVIMIIMQIIALLLSLKKMSVVKAGDVDEVCYPTKIKANMYVDNLMVNGQGVSISGLRQYLVHGDSMKPFGINDGQVVYVEDVEISDLQERKDFYPIAVFNYTTNIDNDCDIKLRKFLTFIDLKKIDINQLHQQYGKYLPIEEFKKEIEKRIETIRKEDPELNGNYILSVTHRYKLNPAKYHYSIHDAHKIQGLVKYAA